MKLAEEIKAKRIVDIQNEKFEIHDKEAGKVVLVEWMEEQRKYYKEHGNNNYSKTIHIESLTMQEMVRKDFTSGLVSYMKDVTNEALKKKQLLPQLTALSFAAACAAARG